MISIAAISQPLLYYPGPDGDRWVQIELMAAFTAEGSRRRVGSDPSPWHWSALSSVALRSAVLVNTRVDLQYVSPARGKS